MFADQAGENRGHQDVDQVHHERLLLRQVLQLGFPDHFGVHQEHVHWRLPPTRVRVRVNSNDDADQEPDQQPDQPDVHFEVVVVPRRVPEHDELGNVLSQGQVARDHHGDVQENREVEGADQDLSISWSGVP